MENNKKQKLIQVITPLIILVVLAALWLMKNGGASELVAQEEVILPLAVTELNMEELKSYGLPIMIDFGADSCVPCKEMAPVLEELHIAYQGRGIVLFVDVWKYPELAKDFPVQLIPTQLFFDADGNPYVPEDPEGMEMNMYTLKTTGEHVYTGHQGGMTKEHIMSVFDEMGVSLP